MFREYIYHIVYILTIGVSAIVISIVYDRITPGPKQGVWELVVFGMLTFTVIPHFIVMTAGSFIKYMKWRIIFASTMPILINIMFALYTRNFG